MDTLTYEEASKKIHEIASRERLPEGRSLDDSLPDGRLLKEQWLEMLDCASRVEPLTSSLTQKEMLDKVWIKLDSLGLYDRHSIPEDHDITIIYNASKIGYILSVYHDMHPVDLLVFGYFCRNLGNLDNARMYYTLSAEKGNVDALIGLATIAENDDLALTYLHQALDRGMTRAYCNIGGVYEMKGEMKKAVEMWIKGAEAGNLNCMNTIAIVSEQEEFAGLIDPDIANEYLNKAVEGNHPFALLLKASRLTQIGKEDEGHSYLKRAADMGNSIAMYHLVHIYNQANDLENMKKWMRQLGDKDDHMTKRMYNEFIVLDSLPDDERAEIKRSIDSLPDTNLGIKFV